MLSKLCNIKGVPFKVQIKKDDEGASLGASLIVHLIFIKFVITIGDES